MKQVVSGELDRLVAVFGPQMTASGDKFIANCVNNVLYVWQKGAPIGNDAWYAIRLALLGVLTNLVTPQDGMTVDAEDVYLSRGTLGSTEKGWCTLEEGYAILHGAGLLTVDSTEDERNEEMVKHFFLPEDVIGVLEYDV